jgi:hypothetical protein
MLNWKSLLHELLITVMTLIARILTQLANTCPITTQYINVLKTELVK